MFGHCGIFGKNCGKFNFFCGIDGVRILAFRMYDDRFPFLSFLSRMKLLGVEGSEQVEGKASGGIGSASETNVFPPPVANPASGDCLHVYM